MADAIDLVIDFATLGEYGLEPSAGAPACQARRRTQPSAPTMGRTSVDRGYATQR